MLWKKGEQKRFSDSGEHVVRFSNQWAVLVDKQYAGVGSAICAIVYKKALSGWCSTAQRDRNQKIPSNLVTVKQHYS